MTSPGYSFTTGAASVISAVEATPEETSATITWTSDENTTSSVSFGTTEAYGSTETSNTPETDHSLELSGLQAGTEYFFQIVSTDESGNVVTSPGSSFTTGAASVISAVEATPEETSATITWTSDENTTSSVSFGTTEAYGSTETSNTPETDHSLELSGLQAGTEYFFQIVSTDESGNVVTSPGSSFTTGAASVISAVEATPPTRTRKKSSRRRSPAEVAEAFGWSEEKEVEIPDVTKAKDTTITLAPICHGETSHYWFRRT